MKTSAPWGRIFALTAAVTQTVVTPAAAPPVLTLAATVTRVWMSTSVPHEMEDVTRYVSTDLAAMSVHVVDRDGTCMRTAKLVLVSGLAVTLIIQHGENTSERPNNVSFVG